MTHDRSRPASIEQVIDETVRCADAMLTCLLTERDNLLARDPDAIQESAREKLALFEALEQLERQRQTLLAAAGYGPDGDAMDHMLQWQPNGSRCRARWATAVDKLAQCRDANQVNGGILELGRRQAEQALAVLRGQTAQPRLYGAGGGTSLSLGHRDLGKA